MGGVGKVVRSRERGDSLRVLWCQGLICVWMEMTWMDGYFEGGSGRSV